MSQTTLRPRESNLPEPNPNYSGQHKDLETSRTKKIAKIALALVGVAVAGAGVSEMTHHDKTPGITNVLPGANHDPSVFNNPASKEVVADGIDPMVVCDTVTKAEVASSFGYSPDQLEDCIPNQEVSSEYSKGTWITVDGGKIDISVINDYSGESFPSLYGKTGQNKANVELNSSATAIPGFFKQSHFSNTAPQPDLYVTYATERISSFNNPDERILVGITADLPNATDANIMKPNSAFELLDQLSPVVAEQINK